MYNNVEDAQRRTRLLFLYRNHPELYPYLKGRGFKAWVSVWVVNV
jgi:hypothetical protein